MSLSYNITQGFETLDFKMLKETAVTNRLETKFLLSESQLAEFLNSIKTFYSVIVFDKEAIAGYSTLYFDTPQFDLYLAHHNKRAKRYKVRQRTYLQNNKSFLEVKYQLGAVRVIKDRIKRESPASWQKNEFEFLAGKLPFQPQSLIPVLSSNYQRITLTDDGNAERVTVDMDLQFSTGDSVHKLSKFAVVEIKQMVKKLSPALLTLKKMELRPIALSKYCLGVNYLYPALKKNNFKQRLLAVDQLTHACT